MSSPTEERTLTLQREQSISSQMTASAFIAVAANELKNMSQYTMSTVPVGCLTLIKNNPGNDKCINCGAVGPEYANVELGTLHCAKCNSIHHKHLRKAHRTLSLYSSYMFTKHDVLSMLEGGNDQANEFLKRHGVTTHKLLEYCLKSAHTLNSRSSDFLMLPNELRIYKTKAARYYKNNMKTHVLKMLENELYQGRSIKCEVNVSDSQSSQTSFQKSVELFGRSSFAIRGDSSKNLSISSSPDNSELSV